MKQDNSLTPQPTAKERLELFHAKITQRDKAESNVDRDSARQELLEIFKSSGVPRKIIGSYIKQNFVGQGSIIENDEVEHWFWKAAWEVTDKVDHRGNPIKHMIVRINWAIKGERRKRFQEMLLLKCPKCGNTKSLNFDLHKSADKTNWVCDICHCIEATVISKFKNIKFTKLDSSDGDYGNEVPIEQDMPDLHSMSSFNVSLTNISLVNISDDMREATKQYDYPRPIELFDIIIGRNTELCNSCPERCKYNIALGGCVNWRLHVARYWNVTQTCVNRAHKRLVDRLLDTYQLNEIVDVLPIILKDAILRMIEYNTNL